MRGLGPRGGRGGHVPADVANPPVVAADGRLAPGLDVAPRALILVLFLGEDELGVVVLVTLLLHQVEREWANLLNGGNGNLVFFA